ncbi:YiiD C-terminal domain-containing protein [Balneatrix alpica]|uniref:YiiD C-terminal domain-containing protein n=1 Tax=Balneatrix alpica TaxID=75684 RepID=A0ABV5ZEH3_9GAMM|nr:YiiD C-terminal domain-containing protein [Balneatrix alpica]
MTPAARIRRKLLENIPLVQHMGVQRIDLTERGFEIAASLAPNVNDKGTGFGGSLAAFATLAGWGMTSVLAEELEVDVFDVVVSESELKYLAPVAADFMALCPWPESELTARFKERLQQKGRARLQLEVWIRSEGQEALQLKGSYVAFKRST